MGLRIYRLTSTNTGGGAGAVGIANTVAIAPGRIVGVAMTANAQAAATTGRMMIELALNNNALSNASSASGAPSEQLCARFGIALLATESGSVNHFIPMNRRISQGNTMCINQDQAGTAFTAFVGGFDVLVEE